MKERVMNEYPSPNSEEYLALRSCLREPITEMYEVQHLLGEAADAHLAGDGKKAAIAIKAADIPIIRDWIESLWGDKNKYPEKVHFLRIREVSNLQPSLPKGKRVKARQPSKQVAAMVIENFGWHCAYCGIGLINRAARRQLLEAYPEALRWGRKNDDKHVAFMAMDNEFDHVTPHSRGGNNNIENLVPSCAPCNCGKENWTLEQLGLIDPRKKTVMPSDWDGLVRLL